MFDGNIPEMIILAVLVIWAIFTIGKRLFIQLTVGDTDGKCSKCGLNPTIPVSVKKNKIK